MLADVLNFKHDICKQSIPGKETASTEQGYGGYTPCVAADQLMLI